MEPIQRMGIQSGNQMIDSTEDVPLKRAQNPLAWMIEVNGIPINVAPR